MRAKRVHFSPPTNPLQAHLRLAFYWLRCVPEGSDGGYRTRTLGGDAGTSDPVRALVVAGSGGH